LLFYRNIDASHPGVVHAMECLEVGARIDNGDARFGLKFCRALASRHNSYFGVG
jgi:hypothetical protein